MGNKPHPSRRALLGAALLAGPAAALDFAAAPAPARMRASADRVIDIAVCTRPFRPQGPRLEAERLHGKHLVHHYGHGGAGWSLSWGSARAVLPLIQAGVAGGRQQQQRIAVIGGGAIGLTSARVAQRAGLRVRIYCKDLPPDVPSSAATGMWSPDSRFCTEQEATPALCSQWEQMARSSFRTWQSLLGLPGDPVQWRDGYLLSDLPFDQDAGGYPVGEPDYPDLMARLPDIRPRSVLLRPDEHPFRQPHVRRFTQMMFNLSVYQRLLLEDFLREGGEIVRREFESPRQIAGLPEPVVVNCTGYGARALFGDQSLVPVKGQTARLVPQPEIDYALIYRGHGLVVLPRRDGLLVATHGEGDYGNADRTPDRGQTLAAVERVAGVYR
ncbi:FAD-dependent oxidoreductase [Roseateles sp. DAIF2]|uniref:FAD-dependent oxidoreductase n=1 Tax=Roseateles sp. DAIF2 TaxID=2714952 RepID=UPI001BC90FA7|nr:FAD-dependent oxidoreductase [Roseateles sp. DAIF2]